MTRTTLDLVSLSIAAFVALACTGSVTGVANGGASGTGGATGTGGSGGTTSGACTVDSDCAPAECGQCPDGETLCPTTRCTYGRCISDPTPCSDCTTNSDCPAQTCSVCLDGSVVCNAEACNSGHCGSASFSVCPSRSGPTC